MSNIYTQYDLNEYKNNTPNYGYEAQSGIGVGLTFLIAWLVNSLVTAALFLTTLIVGIIKKEMKSIFTIINIILLIITFFVPIMDIF